MAVNAALGGRVKRREDRRLITGAGTFTDDVTPERCLHAVFVRSPHAHARIASVDLSAAKTMPGVAGVYQAADLAFESETARPRLCSDEVKFVGDAVVVVVAEGRDQAVDAAAAVIVDYDVLPALVDSTAALAPGALLVHPDKGDNLAFDFDIGEEGALDGADVVVRARFVNQRLAAVPIEAGAVVAEPDGEGGIRMWTSTQVPFGVRTQVSAALGLPDEKVRVIAGDVGGGFGAKLMTYPEQSVLALLA
ncbi:MAG TPA: molybdopterin cofactor-binding domain-containing protein, partial [Gemmatimonadales bacterium]|nr:molybdopterin cofactor-binding domain-containing protein [Gemmatimonadales bacterium]